MNVVFPLLVVLSGVLFLCYGFTTLLRDGMREEFERFGLSQYRRLTGALEVMGAVGLLCGLLVPPLVVVSAAGLSLMMLLGIVTRIRVRDPWRLAVPATLLMVLNAFLSAYAIDTLRAMDGLAMRSLR